MGHQGLARGRCHVIEGDGVAGRFPRLEPGECFRYDSYHVVAADSVAEGALLACDDAGRPLLVRLPPFVMRVHGLSGPPRRRKAEINVCFAACLWHDLTGRTSDCGSSPVSLPFPPKRMDNIIAAQELQIERKHFYIEFRENDRGRFLRITEEAHGRRNTIIVPSTGLDEFSATLDEVLDAVASAPASATA